MKRLVKDVAWAATTNITKALGLTGAEQFDQVYARVESAIWTFIQMKRREQQRLAKPDPYPEEQNDATEQQ